MKVNDFNFNSNPLYIGRYDSSHHARCWFKHVLLYSRDLPQSELEQLQAEPYAHILVPQYWHMVDFGAGVVTGAIMNQFQKNNLGADLFNGSLI